MKLMGECREFMMKNCTTILKKFINVNEKSTFKYNNMLTKYLAELPLVEMVLSI